MDLNQVTPTLQLKVNIFVQVICNVVLVLLKPKPSKVHRMIQSSKNNTSKSTSSFTSSSTESAWYDPLHSSICDSTSSSHQIDVESLAQSLHTSKKHTPLTLASVLVGLLEQHASHHYDVWKLLLIRQTNRSNVQQFRRRKKSLEECIQSTNLHLFRLAVDMGSNHKINTWQTLEWMTCTIHTLNSHNIHKRRPLNNDAVVQIMKIHWLHQSLLFFQVTFEFLENLQLVLLILHCINIKVNRLVLM